MKPTGSGTGPTALRRALAVIEFGVAGFLLWFLGIDALMAPHGGGDVMGTEALRILAPFFIFLG